MRFSPSFRTATKTGSWIGSAERGLFAVTTAAILAVLIWLGLTGKGTRDEMRTASQRAVRVAELRGTIAYLDEWLTMSAQMAAASGERRWAERYDEAAPKLDAAIAEAAELATPDVRATLAYTTTEAHRDLVTMERRGLALAAEGDLATAQALLNGPEFGYLKAVYAGGIEVFGRDLKSLADARAANLNDRAWMEAAGLGLCAVFLVAAVVSLRGRRRLKGAIALTAEVARTDVLTNLPNRHHFYEAVERVLADVERGDGTCALLLIDLDRFKAANDAHGHPAGDHLLQLVAARLRGLARSDDLIARLGGDEFALVARVGQGDPSTVQAEPSALATRVVEGLGESFVLDRGLVVQLGASVGIAVARRGDGALDDFMQRAEVALYQAKSEGRGCFRAFEPGMDASVRSRALLEGDLRQAVANDAIVPHFQPLVEIGTGRLIGFEMLARWPHPTRGMVSPGEFIPIVEDLGLIGHMTEGLLRRACRAAAGWPDHITIACNVSPLHLRDPGLPAMVAGILHETGFPACRLEIEVTESALVGDLALARTLLDQLKALGVRLALDDFGTGYSSLRHLQVLPFDKLKIDASFVGAMGTNAESGKIVSAVVGLGHSLGLLTVAEGVETLETAALLRDLGCDVGQGWLFGRPASAAATDALLREKAEMVPPLALAS